MFQPLQAGEEAEQAAGFSRRADPGGEVGASLGVLHTCPWKHRGDSLPNLFAISYQEALDKYESVMKTEPNVPYYTNLAKERICFSLVKVSGGNNGSVGLMWLHSTKAAFIDLLKICPFDMG